MRKNGMRLTVLTLIAAVLVTVLAGTAFAAGGGNVAVVNELRSGEGSLRIEGTADSGATFYAAAYDTAGKMLEVYKPSGTSWSVSFTEEQPAELRIFSVGSGYVPAAAAIELRPALQVDGTAYWTMDEAEAAADAVAAGGDNSISIVSAYFGRRAAEGYTVKVADGGDVNGNNAFLTYAANFFPLTYSSVKQVNAYTLDEDLTRLAAAYLFTDAAGLQVESGATKNFTDVTDPTDAAVVAAMVDAGFLNGVGGNDFLPAGTVSMETAAQLVCHGIGITAPWGTATQKLQTMGIAGLEAAANAVITQREFIELLCAAADVSVETEADFHAALEGKLVHSVTVAENISLTGEATTCVTTVTKPVTVAGGKKLTVAAYAPGQDETAPEGFVTNILLIAEGGSLTTESGAVLRTVIDFRPNPWHLYRGSICVSGGTLNAEEAGSIEANSFLAYESGEMNVPDDMENVGFQRLASDDTSLRDGMNNSRYTEVLAACDITLTNDLTLTKLLTVPEGSVLTVPAGKTLTVPADYMLSVSGELLVQGTLNNAGTVENYGNIYVQDGTLNNSGSISNANLIDVFGGTLNNSGTIQGNAYGEQNGVALFSSNIGIEDGSTINNFIGETGGTINDCVVVADYYRASGASRCHWYVLEDDHTFDPVFGNGSDNPNFDIMAVGFGTEQVQTALNDMTTWNEQTFGTYEYVIACGTETLGTNAVELGGLTVPGWEKLILKASVFDGTYTYRNEYQVSAGTTLTLQDNSGLIMRGASRLDVYGTIVIGENCQLIKAEEFELGGNIVTSVEELETALANGGEIYLAPFPEEEQTEVTMDWGSFMESQYELTEDVVISHDTHIIPLGQVALFAAEDMDVSANLTLDCFFGSRGDIVVSENGSVLCNNGFRNDNGSYGPYALDYQDGDIEKIAIYGSYENALAAAHDVGKLGYNIPVYPAVEVRCNMSVTDLTIASYDRINVADGASLTITGELTLGTGEHGSALIDTGTIEVKKGGSLNYGGIQYMGGTNPVFSYDEGEDNQDAKFMLTGLPQGYGAPEDVTGKFLYFAGNFTLNSGKTFTRTNLFDRLVVDNVLTVEGTLINNAPTAHQSVDTEPIDSIENRGTIVVKGTLTNNGIIRNNFIGIGHIGVFTGGTFSNNDTGIILGAEEWDDNGNHWYNSFVKADYGASFTNTGNIMDCVQLNDYVGADASADRDVIESGSGSIAELHYAAVVESTAALQRAIANDKYDIYLPIGSFVLNADVTIPEGKMLFLQTEWTDNSGTRENSLTQTEGAKLTIAQGGRAELRADAEFNGDVTVNPGGTLYLVSCDDLAMTYTMNGTLENFGRVYLQGDDGKGTLAINCCYDGGSHGDIGTMDGYGFNIDIGPGVEIRHDGDRQGNLSYTVYAADLNQFKAEQNFSFATRVVVCSDFTIDENMAITKPVYIENGKTLTISADVTYRPAVGADDESIAFIKIEEGASLIVAANGKLTTESDFENNIHAQILLNGGTLDASAGALNASIDYRSGTLILPTDVSKRFDTEVWRRLYGRDCSEEKLAAALADPLVDMIWVRDYMELNSDMTITKQVKVEELDINGNVTVANGGWLEVQGSGYVAVNRNSSLTVQSGGKLVTITSHYLDSTNGVVYVRGTLTLEDGASVQGVGDQNILHLLYDGGTANIGALAAGTVENGYIVFNQNDLDAALADAESTYLQINNGNVSHTGNVTLAGDLRISGGQLTINGDLTVNGRIYLAGGDLIVTGNLTENGGVEVGRNNQKYSSLTVGGNLYANFGLYVEGESQENGAVVTVTGDLVKTNGAAVNLSTYWNKGFVGYNCHFTAANIISTAEGVANLLTNGDGGRNYYLTYFQGNGCFFSNHFTLSHDVTLNVLDSGVWVELLGNLTVNAGVTLTIGDGLSFVVDGDITNNGTVMQTGSFLFSTEHYSGTGSIYSTVSLRDVARTVYQEFGRYPGLNAVNTETDWYNYDAGYDTILNWKQFLNNCFNNEDYDAILGMALLLENNVLTDEHFAFDTVDETWLQSILTAFVNKVDASDTAKTAALGHISAIDLYGADDTLFRGWYDSDSDSFRYQNDEVIRTLRNDLGLYSVEVTTEAELLAALGTPYVTDIHVPQSMTILGTPDSNDTNFDGCCYLNADGRNVNIYLHGVTTLTVGDATHNTKLDVGNNVKIELVRIEDAHARVVVSEGSCINVFGEMSVIGPDAYEYDEFFTGSISYFGNAYWFGERVMASAGQYLGGAEDRLDQQTWNYYRSLNGWTNDSRFTKLVAFGLRPQQDGSGNKWWSPDQPLTYGEMLTVLENIYKVAYPDAAGMPGSVSVGDGNWPHANDIIDNETVCDLMQQFMNALNGYVEIEAHTEEELLAGLNDSSNRFSTVKAIGVTVNGDLTVPAGKFLEIPAFNGDNANEVSIIGNLTVNGTLGVDGWKDKHDPQNVTGATLNVTGNLILNDGSDIYVEAQYGDEGFEYNIGKLNAANVISTNARLSAALTGNGGSYYLLQQNGGYDLDEAITVANNVSIDGIGYNNIGVCIGDTLTVNRNVKLTIGERLGLYPDNVVNNGFIVEYGNIDVDRNNYSGDGEIRYQRNIIDFAEKFYERFAGVPGMVTPTLESINIWYYAKGDNAYSNWPRALRERRPEELLGVFMLLENDLVDSSTQKNIFAPVDEALVKSILSAAAAKILPAGDERWTDVNDYINGIDLHGADNTLFSRYLRTDTEDPSNKWISWQTDEILDDFVDMLELRRVNVSTEEELMNVLELPYVSEIHVTDDITLNGAYYLDGQYMGLTEPQNYNDSNSVYFIPAGINLDQWREIIVEPGVTLTVNNGVKLDIQQNVKLRMAYDDKGTEDGDDDEWGNLTVRGNVNVFGNLEPDENDTRRITLDYAWIAYYGNTYWFSEQLWNIAGQYMSRSVEDVLDEDTLAAYNSMNGWDNNSDFTRLVAYGLTPYTNGENGWWRPGDPIRYGQAITILTNVYREAYGDDAAVLPASVALGNTYWTPGESHTLSNSDVEELLNKFMAVLPKEQATVYSFTMERRDCSQDQGHECDGNMHELVNGSHNNTIRNLGFTQPVTIDNITALDGDDTWGGTITFASCFFEEDITITYNPDYDFRVEFDENCIFAEGVQVYVQPAMNASAAELVTNNNVTLYFGCAGGKVISSAPVRVEAADNVSFIFNGVTVSGTNDNGSFSALMRYNCEAWHNDSFDWEANDHSQCGDNNIRGEYQFVTDRNGAMTVTGSTGNPLPVRIAGTVNIAGLTTQSGQEITLHNWNGQNNVAIGSNNVTIVDNCGSEINGSGNVYCTEMDTLVVLNGLPMNPHVFGRDQSGLFLNMREATGVPTYSLSQWVFFEDWGHDGLQPVNFTVKYYDNDGNEYTGEEQDFDITQMTKVHLYPDDGSNYSDHSKLVLTVNYNGGSVTFDGICWKPLSVNAFVGLLNEKLALQGDDALTLNGLGVTGLNGGNDYLTYGSAKAILSAAWTAMGGEDELNVGDIIWDGEYWDELGRWESDPDHDENGSPDNWTRTWYDAEQMAKRLRNKLGLVIEVTSAGEMLDALEDGWTTINVADDITIDFGEADEHNPHNIYLNRADGVEQQWINVLPGVTFAVGGENGGEYDRVKMDIQEGVTVVLCVDEDDDTIHGVLRVNRDSGVNVFGGLETRPNDLNGEAYDTYVVRDENAYVNYMKRIADFGARTYDCLLNSGLVEPLTADDLETPDVHDCWPDSGDTWALNGMAFLRKYADLLPMARPFDDGGDSVESNYWPSWDFAEYGQVMRMLGSIYYNLTGEDMPASVSMGWTPDYNYILNDNDLDSLLGSFVSALQATLPKTVVENAVILTLHRAENGDEYCTVGTDTEAQSNQISNMHYNSTVTILCDSTNADGHGFVGNLSFNSCEFAGGVVIEAAENKNFGVDFGGSCTGTDASTRAAVTVNAPTGINGPVDYDVNEEELCYEYRVTLKGTNMMDVTANTFVHVEDAQYQAFSITSAAGTLNFAAVDNHYDVDVRWDYWTEWQQGTGNIMHAVPTVQINGEEECAAPVTVSTPNDAEFDGKLRLCGYVDVSSVTMSEDYDRMELADSRQSSNIALGENHIQVYNYCWGNYVFTANNGGSVEACGQNEYAQITLNGIYLGTPHVFGGSTGSIFIGTDELPNAHCFTVQQGDTLFEFTLETFDAEHDGPKTHLTQKGENYAWLTENGGPVQLTVTYDNASVIYTDLWVQSAD